MQELESLQQAEGDLMAVTGKFVQLLWKHWKKPVEFMFRVQAMENELEDKTKVDRGLLNAWLLEVQRTKVKNFNRFFFSNFLLVFFSFRKKQISIENVEIQHLIMRNNFVLLFMKLNRFLSNYFKKKKKMFHRSDEFIDFSYVSPWKKLKNMRVINLMNLQQTWSICWNELIILKNIRLIQREKKLKMRCSQPKSR